MVKIPLADLKIIRWYSLRSKPGQEHKKDYRGAIEVRLQFLLKSSERASAPSLTRDKCGAATSSSESLQYSLSETGAPANPSDETRDPTEPMNINVATLLDNSLYQTVKSQQKLSLTSKHEKREDNTQCEDKLQGSVVPQTTKITTFENECIIKAKIADIPGSSLSEDAYSGGDAKLPFDQSTNNKECNEEMNYMATAASDTMAAMPQESYKRSPNPFDIPANEADSMDKVDQESIDTFLLAKPADDRAVQVSPSLTERIDSERMSSDLQIRTQGEGEQANLAYRSKDYDNLTTERLMDKVIEKDEVIAELKEYIDLLVVRVMDSCPGVLLQPVPSFRK